MYRFSSLERISFDGLYKAFSKAFKDYEIQLSGDELQVMLQRRGFVPELSIPVKGKQYEMIRKIGS